MSEAQKTVLTVISYNSYTSHNSERLV